MKEVLKLINDLLTAIDPFLADQEGATDPRCGLTQPVTVQECELLNETVRKAQRYLEKQEESQKGLTGA